jgi:1-acyl-sn-glycerol-3-phosphate acyltransferase
MPRPKLGNDPFLRGAAARPAAPAPKVAQPRRKGSKKAPSAAVVVEPPIEHVPAIDTVPPPAADAVPARAPAAETAARPSFEASEPPGPDPFGREPAFEARSLRVLEQLYRRYFRVDARGLEHVPSTGPVILVANRAGAVPWDVAMLKCAVALDHPAVRHLRPLADESMLRLPLLGSQLLRFGAVRASRESARTLLASGEAIAVFPEGVRGVEKGFGRRYRLEPFGRGGFIKLALESGAPVVPVAIVGSEEAHPRLTPRLPWLGPLGLWPAPTKWTIECGEPIRFEAGVDANADALALGAEQVRRGLQDTVDRLLRTRRGIFR